MPSPDPVALRGLIERIGAATGPDRELDRDLEALFAPEEPVRRARRNFRTPHQPQDPSPVTDSIDAAFELFDLALPGWSREVGRSGFGTPAWCRAWDPCRIPGQGNDIRADHNGGREALAILLALLSALQAQETDHAAG